MLAELLVALLIVVVFVSTTIEMINRQNEKNRHR